MSEITETVKDYFTSTNFKRDELMDKLSEFLTVERGGVKLYEAALKQVRNREVKEKFREFHQQTIRHEAILTHIIEKLGGKPSHKSAGAKIAEAKANALLKTMKETKAMSRDDAELNAIENIVIAETKDHADWELLGHIAHRSEDSRLAALLKPAVAEVEKQEDEHLHWTQQKLGELTLARLQKNGKQSHNGMQEHNGKHSN
jgi:rubrerythrin